MLAHEAPRHLEAAVAELLAVAQRAGAVRPDVTPAVVLAVVSATCMAADHHAGAGTGDILQIVCDGLRPPAPPATGPERRA